MPPRRGGARGKAPGATLRNNGPRDDHEFATATREVSRGRKTTRLCAVWKACKDFHVCYPMLAVNARLVQKTMLAEVFRNA